jgi:hypothetical protein
MLARTGLSGTATSASPGLLALPARPWDPDRLRVLARSCSLASTLPDSVTALADQASAGALPRSAAQLAEVALQSLEKTLARMGSIERGPRQVPQEAFDIARDFELCLASAAVCLVWLRGAEAGAESLRADGLWLTTALALIVERLPGPEPVGTAGLDAFDRLGRLVLEDPPRCQNFSLFDPGLG